MNSFLPKDYEAPKGSSNYMKFLKGVNRFRILSSAVVGWEYWLDAEGGTRKPVRVHTFDEVPMEYRVKGVKGAKHFWAFLVHNYAQGSVQILEITQPGIMKYIESLVEDEDWGDPRAYDLVVTKAGDGLETTYNTNPKPHSKLDVEVPDIDLQALFKGEDPFKNVKPNTHQDHETIDVGDEDHKSEIDIDELLNEIDGTLPEEFEGVKRYVETPEGAKHSRQYFAKSKKAQLQPDVAQKLVKAKFKLVSYNDVTQEQLDEMIKFMDERTKKAEMEAEWDAQMDEALSEDKPVKRKGVEGIL